MADFFQIAFHVRLVSKDCSVHLGYQVRLLLGYIAIWMQALGFQFWKLQNLEIPDSATFLLNTIVAKTHYAVDLLITESTQLFINHWINPVIY